MPNLRTLIIESGCFNKGPTHLPNSLKVLKWREYPSPSLPNDFHPKKLAILELPASCMAVIEPIQASIVFVCLLYINKFTLNSSDFSFGVMSFLPHCSGLFV